MSGAVRIRGAGFAILACVACVVPARAGAQDHAHMHMPMPAPAPAPASAPKASATKKPPAKPVARPAAKPAAKPAARPAPAPAGERTLPLTTEPASVDHAQIDHAAMDHAQMADMPMPDADEGALPRTPIPPITDADRAAARPPAGGHAAHDTGAHGLVLFDRLEIFDADPGTGAAWELRGWRGGDVDRVWLRSEGERVDGRLERADVEVFYGHATSAWWELLAGIRHDSAPGGARDFAAVGVQGLAPYKIEVAATAYLGSGGQAGLRAEAEYETLFTNRLILQSRVEANAWARGDAARGIGAGLSTIEAGVRLRYQVTRRVAPYVGLQVERAFGDTARLRALDGHDAADTRLVVGLHAWF
jgi:copper resistance protein B